MRHLIPISGKDSLAAALVQKVHEPQHTYELFVNIVNKELPLFETWLSEVERKLGQPVTRIERDLNTIIADQGFLPSSRIRYCTRIAKIEAMEQYLRDQSAYVYFGLRYDERNSRIGYMPKSGNGIRAVYPLIDHRLDLNGVWSILSAKGLLPPPFIFREVEDLARAKMGGDFSITNLLQPWHYISLFTWRTRAFNCYDCFFARQYEYIGLSIYYPDLFEQMCQMEENIGASDYTIREGYTMRQLVLRKGAIIERRAEQVVKILYDFAQQRIFKTPLSDLNITSCGLFCGK